jgi:phage gp29-like protein
MNMAKRKSPSKQFERMTIQDFGNAMELETASILTDFLVQVIGDVNYNSIIINQDRVAKTQFYKELVQFDLYAEVARDPHISSIVNTLKIMIASLDWEIKPFDETARNKAIADNIRDIFEGLDNFQQDLYEFNDAIPMGVSWSEVIYDTTGNDVRIKKLMNRPQRRLQFDGVTREPKLRTKAAPFYGENLQPTKFIVHRASSTWENPFGDALMQNVYWLWVMKRVVLKFWGTHLEVGVAPVPIVKHPKSKDKNLKAEALEIARQLRQSAYARMPDDMDVVFAEAKNMSAAGLSYKDFEEFANDEMTKAILGQVLTTEGGGRGGSGSRALGDVHMDVLQARITFYANALACTLSSSVVKWLTDYNYANVDGYPKFKFVTKKAIDRKTEAEIIKLLHDAGKEVENSYIEDVLEIPLQEIEDVTDPIIPDNLNPDKSNTEVDTEGNLIQPNKSIVKEQQNAKVK